MQAYRFPEPQNAREALTQANICIRAERLWADGYHYNEATGIVTIPEGESYQIDRIADTCSCAASKHHGDCKHRIAVARLYIQAQEKAA